jgi:hypothetical protein
MRRFVAAALSFSATLALAPEAGLAWGDEGHEVVGLIADHHLQPATRAKVQAMLAADIDTLTAHDISSEATWADKYRDENNRRDHYLQTRNWHFVDLEIGAPDLKSACFGAPPLAAGTVASNGPANDCVVDKINEFAAELKAPATNPEERLLALKFLLHFVGDLHQPLHASDNHDQGGNAVKISGAHARNLHAFWDTDTVQKLGTNPQTVAQALIAKISNAQAAQWAAGTPADWAQEAFGLARSDAYGKLPPAGPNGSYHLTAAYIDDASMVAAQQLSRAGVRLAFAINQALGQ